MWSKVATCSKMFLTNGDLEKYLFTAKQRTVTNGNFIQKRNGNEKVLVAASVEMQL